MTQPDKSLPQAKEPNRRWTMHTPVICVAHLTPGTRRRLKAAGSFPVGVANYEQGHFVFVPSDVAAYSRALPADLINVFLWFRAQPELKNEFWLRLDVDGDEIEELPRHGHLSKEIAPT